MATNQYTHRIPSYEKSYIENEKDKRIKHISAEVKQKPNTIYTHPITFYNSPVHTSHLYPNMGLIKPVNYEYIPFNPSAIIDRTIKENQRFVLGPHIIENRKITRWS
jgi:hypothetical protein